MALAYVGDSTADFGGNWATYGGGSPGVDRNVSTRANPWTVPVGGAIIYSLECGMACAPAQEGATVQMGIYNAADDSLIAAVTIESRFDNDPAEYVWHPKATNIPLTAGMEIFIARGKPSMGIWHTQTVDAVSEIAEPSTEVLPSTWETDSAFGRLIPMRFSWEAPSTTVTLSTPVNVGGTGYSATTTDLGPVTSLTNATVTGTSTNAFTYNMNPFQNGVVYLPMGSQLQTASDGVDSAQGSSTIQTMIGYSTVTAAMPLNTGEFSLAKDAAFVAGVVVHWPTAAGTINSNMTLTDLCMVHMRVGCVILMVRCIHSR